MNDEGRAFRPHEVAELLGIPASTLRTYAFQFRTVLSVEASSATPLSGRGFRHRRYVDADLVILRRAMLLLNDGLSYPAVLVRLGGNPLPATEDKPDRRAQPRRPRNSSVPTSRRAARASKPVASPLPVLGLSPPPPPSPQGSGEVQRDASPEPQPIQIELSGLTEVAVRLGQLESIVGEQNQAIDRIERALSTALDALQEVKLRLIVTPPLSPPAQEPARRGWLAHLFGGHQQ